MAEQTDTINGSDPFLVSDTAAMLEDLERYRDAPSDDFTPLDEDDD